MSDRTLGALDSLAAAWEGVSKDCLAHAHGDNGISPQSKAIFAGRSDAYHACSETLKVILSLLRRDAEPAALRPKYDELIALADAHTSGACPDCATLMERKPDVSQSYELRGEKAEWPAPYWECPGCGFGCAGEHQNDNKTLAMEKMYARVIRKLEVRLAAYE